MNFNIYRYEKNKNHDGDIVSIFVALGINDDAGESTYIEHFLTQEEMELVFNDENNLKPILEKVAAEGFIKLENEIPTKPMPPIIEDVSKVTLPKIASVVAKVASIKAEEAKIPVDIV